MNILWIANVITEDFSVPLFVTDDITKAKNLLMEYFDKRGLTPRRERLPRRIAKSCPFKFRCADGMIFNIRAVEYF